MSFTVAIIGQPNVGKSTLFNLLTKRKSTIVYNSPEVTRDRIYREITFKNQTFTLIDTGGFIPLTKENLSQQVNKQIKLAFKEANLLLFLVDGKTGISHLDYEITKYIRYSQKSTILTVNKIDTKKEEHFAQEFHKLGFKKTKFISAAHSIGIEGLLETIVSSIPNLTELKKHSLSSKKENVKVSVVGRPNVGKSSLINKIINESRVVVSPIPGTTRDVVEIPFLKNNKKYTFIDTSGIRKQGRIDSFLEKESVSRSIQNLSKCHIAICVIDAYEGLTDQDLRIMGKTIKKYLGFMVIINKYDLLKTNNLKKKELLFKIKQITKFAPWTSILFTSAKTGEGVKKILPTIDKIYYDYNRRIETGPLNRTLQSITKQHQPPIRNKRRLKLLYATQTKTKPPEIIIFTNYFSKIHFSYHRYLVNSLRSFMKIKHSPLKIFFKTTKKK